MGDVCPTTASAADVCRNFGLWQDRALKGPVMVTNHGRVKAVLLSVDAYEGLVDTDHEAGGGDAVTDRMAEGFVRFDERLRVTHANRAAAFAFRQEVNDVLGREPAQLFDTLAPAVLERILMRVAATGEARRFEATGRDDRTFRMDAFPVGRGVGLVFACVDADRETAARLAEYEALDSLLAANGQAGCGRIGLRGAFTGAGTSLAALTGYAEDQLRRVRLVDLVADQCRENVAAALESVLVEGTASAVDAAIVTSHGDEVDVTLALAPMRTDYAIDGATLLVTPARTRRTGVMSRFG